MKITPSGLNYLRSRSRSLGTDSLEETILAAVAVGIEEPEYEFPMFPQMTVDAALDWLEGQRYVE